MAASQYTAADLYNAVAGERWDEARQIIRDQGTLVNEKYNNVTLLEWIVQVHDPPHDLVLKCVESAKKETIDYKWCHSDRYILHDLADHGITQALHRALRISDRHVNSQTRFGDTPLHLLLQAEYLFSVDAIQLLLDYGADISIKNDFCDTPLHQLLKYSFSFNKEAIHLLLYYGADSNIKNNVGDTPLHLLLRAECSFIVHLDAIQMLLDYEADSSFKNDNNLTPLDVYTQNQFLQDDDAQKKQLLQLLLHHSFVDEDIIEKVSNGMDITWRRFGVRLGLKWSEVNSFNAEGQIRKSVENMLNNWRSSIDNKQHHLKVLCTALRQHNFKRLAKHLFLGYISDNKIFIKTTEKDYFDDQDLLFVCDDLEFGWKKLGERLKLKQTQLDAIKKNNKFNVDRTMEVLVTWRDGQSTNQVPIMLKVLRQNDLLVANVCDRHGYTECEAPLDIGYYAKMIGLFVGALLSFVLFVLVFFEDEESYGIVIKVLSGISFLATVIPLMFSYLRKNFTLHKNRRQRYTTV